ncbi:MAG: hypothetical protein MJE66_16030 [Proteobacteria bacterium]|nr:hypothetical protein [Pseudomonadota bacterium]
MSRRRRPQDSYDSLLDTMANVVGILVVLLAVTQLSVGDAMQRIRDVESERRRERLDDPEAGELARLRAAWEEEAARDDANQRELAWLGDRIAALRALPRPSEADNDQLASTLAATRVSAERLAEEVKATDERLARLRVRLAGMAPRRADWQVRMPDPRPAPAGSEPMAIFCRYRRCFVVDFQELDRLLNAGLRAATAGSGAPGSGGGTAAVDHFRRNDLGDDHVRMELGTTPGRRALSVTLRWRSEREGETLEEFRRSGSELSRDIARHRPSQRYADFYVWSDSFGPYLAARELVEAAGFSAGWWPLATQDEYVALPHSGELNPIPID